MKAIVDKNLCIGCGTCSVIAEGSFKLGDDGKAEFLDPAQPDQETKIQEAIDSCPVSAIKSLEATVKSLE